MIRNEQHPSALALDALVLDSLGADEALHVREHVAHCERCQRHVEGSREAREEFHRSILPRTLPRVRERAERSRFSWSMIPMALVPAAAAILLFIVPPRSTREAAEADLAIKGGSTLRVYARHGEKVFPLQEGTALHTGDQLRFVAEPAGLPYLLIVSVDGKGNASTYVPYAGASSLRLDAKPRIELPDSLVLDATPGPERLYALFTREPLDAKAALAEARRIGARGWEAIRRERKLAVAAETQTSILIEKAPP